VHISSTNKRKILQSKVQIERSNEEKEIVIGGEIQKK
jgi:hypothetical protein